MCFAHGPPPPCCVGVEWYDPLTTDLLYLARILCAQCIYRYYGRRYHNKICRKQVIQSDIKANEQNLFYFLFPFLAKKKIKLLQYCIYCLLAMYPHIYCGGSEHSLFRKLNNMRAEVLKLPLVFFIKEAIFLYFSSGSSSLEIGFVPTMV